MRLVDRYSAFLLDLDGVIYRGDEPVPGASEAVAELRRAGKTLVFLTNNSARTPEQVAEKLDSVGVQASPDEVLTSAQATAPLIARWARADERPPTAFVIGERGLREALTEEGIEVLDGDPRDAGFVVVGWDRGVDYEKLRTASVLVGRGARLVATNADASYPAPGAERWPGAGALLAAVEVASTTRADVVGKPHGPLFEAAVERAGSDDALMIGDRLETDVAGAAAGGLDSAFVLTGASSVQDLLDQDAQPVAVLDDLLGLHDDRPDAAVRPAQGDDAEGIAELLDSAGLAPDPGPPEEAIVAGGTEIVATAATAVRGREAYLHSVAVRKDARGHNVGTLAVAGAGRAAARRGAALVYLLTEDAEGFFARLGFEPFDRQEVPGWVTERSSACSDTAVGMRRRLRSAQSNTGATLAGRRR
jgi:HAD superfamily hydrolase (TIGR01457 family)